MNFTVGSSIRFGWETFKKRPWFFIVTFLIIGLLSSAAQVNIDNKTVYTASAVMLMTVAGIVGFVIQILVKMGTNRIQLKAHQSVESVSLRDLWAPRPFLKYVGAYFLVVIIVIAGLILLIVPGVMWALKYMFVPLIVMEKKMGPLDSLKESARITYGHKWDLFIFAITLIGINIFGLACLLIGLLVAVPVTSFAFVHAYKTLSKSAA